MGGRNSGSGVTGGANSTASEKKVARSLNQGDWEKASNILAKEAGSGSEISVGAVNTFTRTDEGSWRHDGLGNPTFVTTTTMTQMISDMTYDGQLKAKVKIKPKNVLGR